MNIFKKTLAGSLAAITLASASVASAQMGPAEAAGTILGGVLGGVAGSRFGQGAGKGAAIGAGVLLGAVVGHEFGEYLDDREEREYQEARREAVRRREAREWRNSRKRFHATFTPRRDLSPRSNRYTICREFESRVWINGRLDRQSTEYSCSDRYGNWYEVSHSEINWNWQGTHDESWGHNSPSYPTYPQAPVYEEPGYHQPAPPLPSGSPNFELLGDAEIETIIGHLKRMRTADERLEYIAQISDYYRRSPYRIGYLHIKDILCAIAHGRIARDLGPRDLDQAKLEALRDLAPLRGYDGGSRDIIIDAFETSGGRYQAKRLIN